MDEKTAVRENLGDSLKHGSATNTEPSWALQMKRMTIWRNRTSRLSYRARKSSGGNWPAGRILLVFWMFDRYGRGTPRSQPTVLILSDGAEASVQVGYPGVESVTQSHGSRAPVHLRDYAREAASQALAMQVPR